ncbi:cytochrome b5 [Piromyces finnis]|uniref:Cytochrome b5 n=1 Tax=Piromyces finnis TaxID=1754191 RepID=A0A1Y1VCX1_9FUNG|nr:cytochrome b5 [Piromyces finnis]|eukprot:ORX52958.1 cytochrome b5 [Piromyces finnis]
MAFIHRVSQSSISNEEFRSRLNKKYTMEEVSKHCTIEDCWIIFNGIIYDITEYLNFHPGGKNILIKYAGKDGTDIFYKCHPWVDCNSLLKNYAVGSLAE